MKGWKLNLKNYKITTGTIDENNQVKEKEEDYKIRKAIANILLHPQQKHQGFRILKVFKLAEKIEECKEDYILINLEEKTMLKQSFEAFVGFSRNDIELLKRVESIEEVDLKEEKR